MPVRTKDRKRRGHPGDAAGATSALSHAPHPGTEGMASGQTIAAQTTQGHDNDVEFQGSFALRTCKPSKIIQ